MQLLNPEKMKEQDTDQGMLTKDRVEECAKKSFWESSEESWAQSWIQSQIQSQIQIRSQNQRQRQSFWLWRRPLHFATQFLWVDFF